MINKDKAALFAKHLANAHNALQKKDYIKEDLKKQFKKIKGCSDSDELKAELVRLESMVEECVMLENQAIKKESQDSTELKKQMKELKLKLSLMDSGDITRSLNKMSFLLGSLASKMDSYMQVRSQHDEKVNLLEQRIKERMEDNFGELKVLEAQISKLERLYEDLRDKEGHDVDHLMRIDNKLEQLRNKLIEKREEIISSRANELPMKIDKPKIRRPDFGSERKDSAPLIEKEERKSLPFLDEPKHLAQNEELTPLRQDIGTDEFSKPRHEMKFSFPPLPDELRPVKRTMWDRIRDLF